MKRAIIILLGTLVAGITFAQTSITIEVEDVESNKGNMIFMLFESEKGFPSDKSVAHQVVEVQAEKGAMKHTFENVLPGEYAITVGHDENANGELDKNFIGMPKERVGVSNQFKFGKPSFNRSKVMVTGDKEEVNLQVKFLN